MRKLTIDIDKKFNDEHVGAVKDRLLNLPSERIADFFVKPSAHDRIHVDVVFGDGLGYDLKNIMDHLDMEDMYLLIYRLAAGDDIKRLRVDAAKYLRGEEIDHWLPSKEDYERMRDGK